MTNANNKPRQINTCHLVIGNGFGRVACRTPLARMGCRVEKFDTLPEEQCCRRCYAARQVQKANAANAASVDE